MSDARSSFKAMKAARTVITKEWLKRGLGEGANYLDGVSIWRQDNKSIHIQYIPLNMITYEYDYDTF